MELRASAGALKYDAVLFDLLTALIDSWTLWDAAELAGVGLPTLWHNRAGLARPEGAPAPMAERRTLLDLVPFI